MKVSRKALSPAPAIAAAVVAVLGMAPPALADAGTTCPDGVDDCGVFYYSSGSPGSFTAFRGSSVPDLSGYTFLAAGTGKGEAVKNNAASFWNASVNSVITVFYNSNYSGPCDTFAPGAETTDRLANTYNDNASMGIDQSGVNCYKWE